MLHKLSLKGLALVAACATSAFALTAEQQQALSPAAGLIQKFMGEMVPQLIQASKDGVITRAEVAPVLQRCNEVKAQIDAINQQAGVAGNTENMCTGMITSIISQFAQSGNVQLQLRETEPTQ